MRWAPVLNLVGVLCLFLGLSMILPLLTDIFYDHDTLVPWLVSMALSMVLGGVLLLGTRKAKTSHLSQREGVAIVVAGWLVVGFLGALPFYFSTSFASLTDALFESISGFTTTGASILTDVEALSHGLLLWRSLIQWLGGMGIIVLSIAILPFLGIGGMQLFKAEVPSPTPDKLKPRIRDTATILWKVYVLFTALQVLVLWLGGMGPYDAVCHAFTTMPTGGFSTKTASIAHYDSCYFDVVFIIFMLLAGVNFSLHYQMLRGKPLAFWRDSECRFYLGVLVFLCLIVTVDLHVHLGKALGEALRYGSFQVVSLLTTTGYATADYEQWPAMSQLVLLLCMFAGASAGSTGGGMKMIRVMLCFKFCVRELLSLIHPHGIYKIKLNGTLVSEKVMASILAFLALYMTVFALGSLVLASMGVDVMTSVSAVASCVGNIGPAFGSVGPTENYALLPEAAKWLLSGCMILGRLEIYTLIIFLVPEFWRK